MARDGSLRDGFGALVARTARQWRRAVDRELQPFDLSEATWLPLLHLSRAARPMRQKDLAASLALDNSAVVRLLDALEAAGLVERRGDAADRRAKAIVLTRTGAATVAKVEAVSRRLRQQLLTGLPEADLATAARVLDAVCRRLDSRAEADAA
jgi:MarR family transcriptional regulator for hemolysin